MSGTQVSDTGPYSLSYFILFYFLLHFLFTINVVVKHSEFSVKCISNAMCRLQSLTVAFSGHLFLLIFSGNTAY